VKVYSGGFTAEHIYRNELKIVANLQLKGLSKKEMKDKVFEENLFHCRSEAAMKDMFPRVYKRADLLDDSLRGILLNGSRSDNNAILLYAFLKTFNFPKDFVLEVIHYNLIISLFEDIGGLEGLKHFEEEQGTEELFEAIHPSIEEEQLVDLIAEEEEEADIIFVTGGGSTFQLVSTHELLNQLHSRVTNTPIIIFYPGEYSGQGLRLFNRFESTGYYRAFSI